MATKKQKHAANIARREEFLAKERELGRQAIEVENRKREIRTREAWKKGHEKHFRFIDECPHCTEIKTEQARKKAAEAVERVAAAAKKAAEAVERVAAAAKKMLELSVPAGRKTIEPEVLEEDESIDLARVSE